MLNVCAVILDYFGVNKTIACLNSLLGQGIDSVIIVYNSGDNNANRQLKEGLSIFEKKEPSFVIYQMVNSCNLGFAAGVNNALRWMENNYPHRYYLLINNDAQATSGMLREMHMHIANRSDIAIVSPLIKSFNNNISSILWYHRYTGLLSKYKLLGFFPYITGCCMLIDSQRIDVNNLFDNIFFMYGEDIELCWRLKNQSINFVCETNAILLHEGVGSSAQGYFFYEYHMAKCHFLLARKLVNSSVEIPFLFICRIFFLSLRAIVRSIRYKNPTPLHALYKALLD